MNRCGHDRLDSALRGRSVLRANPVMTLAAG